MRKGWRGETHSLGKRKKKLLSLYHLEKKDVQASRCKGNVVNYMQFPHREGEEGGNRTRDATGRKRSGISNPGREERGRTKYLAYEQE